MAISLYLYNYLQQLMSAIDNLTQRLRVNYSLPDRLMKFRDSFATPSQYQWLIGGGLVLLMAIFIGMLLWTSSKNARKSQRISYYNPDKLFDRLIGQVDLSKTDKHLLHEMIKGARLKHPAMALLSPGMLDWSCRLWLKEKGPGRATPEKIEKISAIAVKLYDHRAY